MGGGELLLDLYLLDSLHVFVENFNGIDCFCNFFSLGCYSTVVMELVQKEDCTVIELKQSGIPDYDIDKTESGWKRYFWASIKQTFGYGARLF